MPRIAVFHADNLAVLQALPDACVDLIYIDPPFNTGKVQQRARQSYKQLLLQNPSP